MEENYEQKEYAIDPDADSRRLYLYCYDGTGLLGIGKFGGTVCCDAFVLLSGKRCPASAGSLWQAERGKVKQEQEEKAEQEDAVSEDAQQKGVSESNGWSR